MGHGKETPRQKMIGLMYLFLTAMLALNVSKEVLNSFILVGESMEQTISNYKNKNEKIYNEFDKQNMSNPKKVGPWRDLAYEVREDAKNLFELLEGHKVGLAKYSEGEDTESVVDGKFKIEKLEQKDNIDKGGEYFGELGKKHGIAIEEEIDKYREHLLSIVPKSQENLRNQIEQTLHTHEHKDEKEGTTISWVSHTFEHIPLIADFVMLSKLQTDVKNMETDVINYLFRQISASDFKVNAMDAIVIPNSNYIMRGSEYRAQVFLAAYDSTQAPTILVGNYREENGSYEMIGDYDSIPVEQGKGIYETVARSTGDKEWGGLIKIKSPDGGEEYFPFKETYSVSEPNFVVSPTKMNVFYFGIDNPVEVSVPGIPADKINPRIRSGATIKKARGGYVVKPTKQKGTVNVEVYAEIDGNQKSMGSMPFRIKTVPTPVAKVLGQTSGPIDGALLAKAPGVSAVLEDFVFDLSFRVTRFTVTSTIGGYTTELNQEGNKFSREQKELIGNIKRGQNIIIEKIEAIGPDGRAKPLSPIVFKVK